MKVAVGLSGGVDSAVAALLLKRAGFVVVGVHLYCYPAKSEVEKDGLTREEWIKKNGCRADEDKQAALKTALELSIPFKTLDFSEEYNKRVIDYFYREYEAGRTPNPDVLCNSEIKFGLFLDWAIGHGFDYVATGHYAKKIVAISPSTATDNSATPAVADHLHTRPDLPLARDHADQACVSSLRGDNGYFSLAIPKDKHKDQTYFLWKLTQKDLAHVLFPLSDLTKPEVRKIAKEAELSVAARPDSQGICFVGNVDARKFLARRLREKEGEVKNTKGEVIGHHKGVWFYTIGQRGGWDIIAKAQSKYMSQGKTPVFYIVSKDAKKNELVVGLADEAVGMKFRVGEINWIAGSEPAWVVDHSVLVRIRHGGKLILAVLSGNEVVLGEAQRGIAPGQSAVFYCGNGQILGGGVIE